MAKEIDQKQVEKLAKIVKSNPGESERFYAEKSGIAMGQILRYLVLAELVADPSLKIPSTGKAIAKARNEGVRWPRIAARAGLSESKAKELFEAETGTSARDSYSGRGRNFSGTPSTAKTATSGRRGTSKSTTAASRGTSGRRGTAKTSTAKSGTAKSSTAKRGTRRGVASDPK